MFRTKLVLPDPCSIADIPRYPVTNGDEFDSPTKSWLDATEVALAEPPSSQCGWSPRVSPKRHGESYIHGENSETTESAQVDIQLGHNPHIASDSEVVRTTRTHKVSPQTLTRSDISCDHETFVQIKPDATP